MILVDPKDRSGNHYINERALTFSENDLEDPQRIAVSLVSGTVIMVNKKDDGDGVSIPRAANGDYEKWTLKGYSTKIPEGRNAAHYIFARLSRSERTALIVFSLNNYNIDGSVSTFTTNEDGSVTELRSEASSDYYYIRIGYLSETDGSSDRVLTYDCGQLSVGYEIDDIRGAWNELFVPHYDDPANPKELTWIEAKSHMGVNGGVTMFVDNGSLDLPSLYEGLPVDGDTLYWEEDEEGNKVLKAKTPEETTTTLGSLTNVGEWADGAATADRIMVQKKGSDQWVSLSLEELGTASFENVKESGEGNAYTSIVLSEDKKTLTLKKGETFAKQSDYEALNTKVTDFLEGEDTDTIINKWKELETFLGGMSESDELATILSGKADKGTTLEDYGITDAYTKTEIDSALDDYVTIKGKEEITGEKNFTGGLKVNGSPIVYDKDNEYWKLDGDLLITGAVTMFANEGKYTPSTIMDAVSVDGSTIMNDGSKLYLNPDLELGGGLDESALASYLTTNKYLTQTTGDTRYVTALGTSGNYLTYTKNGVTTDVTVPYATTAKELTSYSAITFSKSDNGGKPCYLLIADVTSWYNVSSGSLSYGIVGFVYGYRDGATPAYSVNIAARCSYGKGYYSLNSNLTSIIESRVVSYNSKYYLALYLRGSNRTFNFIGRKDNLLSSFTELQCSDSSGTYSGLSVIYSGSAIGTASTATKLSTARIISITGHATGSGSFDGSSDLGINVAIPTRNVYINGTGYTVHSTITTDTTGVYAPISGGTSGYVLKANGATSIPTWVAQSSLSVGTAAKLSTVSKTAWGQTYWTSGGVPTSISGDMTGVGSITMSGFINYNDYTVFRYSASTGDGGVSTGASLLGSPSLATTLRSSGDDLYHWNEANSAKYLIFDTNNFTNYTNKALTKKNSGTNLLTDGDKYIGAQNYLIGTYTYASFVTNGVKYRCTLCGKLGDDNTHIAAYWDGGLGNNTTISGLSSTEERTISFTATITNKQRLSFYQFPNGKFGSYIKWCKLEVEEDVTGDTSTYLYNIDRIDFANDSNSHNFGIDRNGTVYGYNAGVLKLRRGISSGGSFVQYEANNQTVYGWRAGSDNSYKFSWWYYNTSSGTDEQKMSLDSSGNLQVTGDVYTDNSYFVKGTTGAGNGYSLYNESLPTQYGIFMGTTSNFNKHGGVTGGWATYFCMNGYNESRGWIFRNSYNSTNVASITTNGDLLVNGGITMYSDERKKTILNHVELSLKEVADAPLIEHYYNSDDRKTIHVGSIAQYWAGLNDWFCKKDSEGFYTMEIQNAALASAISVARELSRFESDTDRRIRLLEEENRELRKEIEQLKSV